MPTTDTRRLKPAALLGIVLGIAVLAIVLVRSFTREVVEIRAAAVDHQNLVSSVPTNGKVEPIHPFSAHAAAPGVVAKIYVKVEQKVKAGDLLIRMDDSDAVARLATANASLRTAQANLHDLQQGGSQDERIALSGDLSRAKVEQQDATRSLAALKQLQQKGAASASEVASAEQRLQSANNSLQNIQMRSTQRYSSPDRARAEAQLADAQGWSGRGATGICGCKYPFSSERICLFHSGLSIRLCAGRREPDRCGGSHEGPDPRLLR